jgi:hypothetical protein
MVSHFNKNHVPFSDVFKLAEFFSAFLEPMLPLKGYFPLMNGVNTLKAMSVTKVKYDKTCVEFFKILLTKKVLLKKIHNSKKYNSFASSYF